MERRRRASAAARAPPVPPAPDPRLRRRVAFGALLGCALLLRGWCAAVVPLSGDEAYFWEWSRHLALGYHDHPGLAAWAIAASTRLLGAENELAVRLPALLSMALVAWRMRALGLRLSSDLGLREEAAERAASLAGLLALVVPLFAFFGLYASGDALLLLAWVSALELGWRAARDGRWRSWFGLGVAMGAGIQAKLLFLPFLPAFALFLAASPQRRRWLARPQPWAALGVSLALAAPFLAWNAANDWATLRFNFAERHDVLGGGLAFLELVASQALVLSPGVVVLALLAARKVLARRGAASAAEVYLLTLFAVPLAGHVALSLLGRQIGAHWPAPAWLAALLLLAAHVERTRQSGAARRAHGMVLATLGLGLVLTLAGHAALVVPPAWLARLPLSHPTRPDQFNAGRVVELRGWRELGLGVAAARARMLARAEPTPRGVFLLAAQYGFAAQVAFYTPGQPEVSLWEPPRRHGQSYRSWERFEELGGQDALFVTKHEERVAPAIAKLRQHFERVHAPERLPVVVGGRELRAYYLVRCEGFDGSPPRFP